MKCMIEGIQALFLPKSSAIHIVLCEMNTVVPLLIAKTFIIYVLISVL
jgi:hypothetical protein